MKILLRFTQLHPNCTYGVYTQFADSIQAYGQSRVLGYLESRFPGTFINQQIIFKYIWFTPY